MPKKTVASDLAEESGHGPKASAEAKAPKKGRSEAVEEAAFRKTADQMKAMLAAQPQVGVYVPLEQGEPKGTQLPVEINGYRVNVPKGVPNVQVPKSVAEIIWQSLGIYDEASSNLRSVNDPNRPLRLDLQKESDRSALDA
jgi:hypothetical protein